MANSYKTLLPEDVANTRTLLHEAIPITGTIVSGTYDDENIKYFAHGMYEAVYDYPYLSSSANHIFDLTVGYASGSAFQSSTNVQDQKKINIYNQMAQVLVGYDVSGNIQQFDEDGDTGGGTKMESCFFINFARLLTKDEIKKQSLLLKLYRTTPDGSDAAADRTGLTTISDYDAQTEYFTNSPAGEYGLLYTASAAPKGDVVGHVYYQAGVVVLTSSIFTAATPTMTTASAMSTITTSSVEDLLVSGTIDECGNAIRYAYDDVDYNNTTELNSTIYFCRANNTEFNYSSNPTYLSSSEIVVKGNNPQADPVAYITTVGLYSPDNELLGVAKLSEPLKKTPSNEITLRVRMYY
jgi:hypothetical protein